MYKRINKINLKQHCKQLSSGSVVDTLSVPFQQKRVRQILSNSATEAPIVQKKDFSQHHNNTTVSAGLSHQIKQQSSGTKLDQTNKTFFESRFNSRLDNVRIHNNQQSHDIAQQLNAKAFTLGNNIFFDKNQYAPQSHDGKKLLAHELTHVIQQQGDASPDTIQRVSWSTDENNCRITGNFDAQAVFAGTSSYGWTPTRQTAFLRGMKTQVESAFNGNSYRIIPGNARRSTNFIQDGLESVFGVDYSCPCSSGFSPRVNLTVRSGSITTRADDWNVSVAANPRGTFRQSTSPTSRTGETFGRLDEADVNAGGSGQVPVVHEFGHTVGLDHPGHGIAGVSNEYSYHGRDSQGRTVDGRVDLMGRGMGLRPFYFQRWANALNGSYSGCQYSVR